MSEIYETFGGVEFVLNVTGDCQFIVHLPPIHFSQHKHKWKQFINPSTSLGYEKMQVFGETENLKFLLMVQLSNKQKTCFEEYLIDSHKSKILNFHSLFLTLHIKSFHFVLLRDLWLKISASSRLRRGFLIVAAWLFCLKLQIGIYFSVAEGQITIPYPIQQSSKTQCEWLINSLHYSVSPKCLQILFLHLVIPYVLSTWEKRIFI